MQNDKRKFVLTVYIGRFSPFHNGQAGVLKRAASTSDSVLVLIGSINNARNPKNPWTVDERASVIRKFSQRQGLNVTVRGIRDFPYNDQLWIANVHKTINEVIIEELKLNPSEIDIRITGADRDSSTFYLKFFPSFTLDLVDENMEVSRFLTATNVREIYFGKTFNKKQIDSQEAELLLTSFVPIETIQFLKDFEEGEEYVRLSEEHMFNVKYREPYKDLPYEVIFHTVDAVVFQTGYVLLVKRRANPGKGLWALPGGFLDPKERLFDAAIRELKEETKIKVPEPVLRGSMIFKDNFDYPDRSLRGRTITTAFLFNLPNYIVDGKVNLPSVKGADDAEKAMWVPIDEAMKCPEFFFEDHYYIIEAMLGKI